MGQNETFGILITNSFRTLTGGILYYNYNNLFRDSEKNKTIYQTDTSARSKLSL